MYFLLLLKFISCIKSASPFRCSLLGLCPSTQLEDFFPRPFPICPHLDCTMWLFATVNSVLCVLLCHFSRQTFLASLLLSSNCTSSTCTLARRRPTKTHRPLAVINGASCGISLLSNNSSSVTVAYFISVIIVCVNGSFIYVYDIPIYCIFCDVDNCSLTSAFCFGMFHLFYYFYIFISTYLYSLDNIDYLTKFRWYCLCVVSYITGYDAQVTRCI